MKEDVQGDTGGRGPWFGLIRFSSKQIHLGVLGLQIRLDIVQGSVENEVDDADVYVGVPGGPLVGPGGVVSEEKLVGFSQVRLLPLANPCRDDEVVEVSTETPTLR